MNNDLKYTRRMWGVKIKEAEEKTNQKRENIHVRRKSPVCWKSVSDRECTLVTYAMVCEFDRKECEMNFRIFYHRIIVPSLDFAWRA